VIGVAGFVSKLLGTWRMKPRRGLRWAITLAVLIFVWFGNLLRLTQVGCGNPPHE